MRNVGPVTGGINSYFVAILQTNPYTNFKDRFGGALKAQDFCNDPAGGDGIDHFPWLAGRVAPEAEPTQRPQAFAKRQGVHHPRLGFT